MYHTDLVCRALESDAQYLIVDAPPRSGKSTAVREYCRDRADCEDILVVTYCMYAAEDDARDYPANVVTTSVFEPQIGRSYDCIIVNDPVMRMSDAESREHVTKLASYIGTLRTRLKPHGKLRLLGSALMCSELFAELRNQETVFVSIGH